MTYRLNLGHYLPESPAKQEAANKEDKNDKLQYHAKKYIRGEIPPLT